MENASNANERRPKIPQQKLKYCDSLTIEYTRGYSMVYSMEHLTITR